MSLLRRLWDRRESSPLFVALSVLTVAVLLSWPVVDFYLRQVGVGIPFGFNDFGAYMSAIHRVRTGGSLYQMTHGSYHGSYLYPPVTALIFHPFLGFDFKTGAIIFVSASLVLLWVGVESVARVLGYELGVAERLLLLVALFGFQPALRDYKWAQISSLLAALLCFAFYTGELAEETDDDRYRYASGALTTLGSAFKLFFATSGAHLLRDRKRFAGAMAAAGVLAVVSVVAFGVEMHRDYVDVLMWGKGWGGTRAPYLWDTSAAYRPLYMLGNLGMAARVVGVFGTVGLTLAARRDDSAAARRATFALGVAVIPLLAPLADSHDLVVMLLPAVILLALELDRPDGYPWIPVLAVLLFHLHRYSVEVAINRPDLLPVGSSFVRAHAPWFQTGMWATFLLVGLAAVRVAEHAALPDWADAVR
ncbi:MAG: glycosyltransferase family 87 protein [Halobacteriaceae archaeon]